MTHCDLCQGRVETMRRYGYVYSARQSNNDDWDVSFMSPSKVIRASAPELHDAIDAAVAEEFA